MAHCISPVHYQIISGIIVSLVGYACGTSLALPGILLHRWKNPQANIALNPFEASLFASILQLVSIFGSVFSGLAVEKTGPRRLILLFLPLLAGSCIALIAAANNSYALILIRASQGILMPCLETAAYLYPCEVSDVKNRGLLASLLDATYSLGFVAIYLMGKFVPWQHLGFAISLVAVLPCFIGVLLVPESPYWLARQGRTLEAKCVLLKVRSTGHDVDEEIESVHQSHDNKLSLKQNLNQLKKLNYCLPVTCAVTLLSMKELSGQYAVILYLPQVFDHTSPFLYTWGAALVGTVRILCNLLCSVLLRNAPRKCFLIISSCIATVPLLGLAIFLDYGVQHMDDEQALHITLFSLLIYVIVYSLGIGPVCWLLAAELQPSATRSIGSGFAMAGFNLSQCFVAAIFTYLSKIQLVQNAFYMFVAGNCFLAIFVLVAIRDTKGKSSAEINEYWENTSNKYHSRKADVNLSPVL